MSTDETSVQTVNSVGRQLPDRKTMIEHVIFFCYLTTIIIGLTLFVTLELFVRM